MSTSTALMSGWPSTTTTSSSAHPQTPRLPLREVVQRFWPYARPYRWSLAATVVFVIASPAVEATTIWLYKLLLDDVVVPLDFEPLPRLALLYIGLTLLGGVVGFADRCLSTWVGQRFLVGLRTALFRHVQDLSLDFFERKRLGDVLSRLTGDVGAIENFVVSGVGDALSYAFRILFFIGALFYVEWHLALVVLATAVMFWAVSRRFIGPIKEASREKRRRNGAIGAVAEEALANAMLVQAYNRQETEVHRFHQQNLASFAAEMASARLKSMFVPLVDLVEVIGVIGVIAVGTWELSQGALSLGGLLVFLTYVTKLYSPIRGLTGLGNSSFQAAAAAERIVELFDQRPAVIESPTPVGLDVAIGVVTFDNVTFEYPGTTRPAISDLSFEVRPGETVALVGASGAGKSTVARLLLRFYDPLHGRVLLDGIDLRDLSIQALRDNVVVLLQETFIFDGTIAENIAYGRPTATTAEIVQAARDADAHEFISALPDGYNSRIGQKGRRLSGGQRQRIGIARAFIRDAPILLLDEPTTALDSESGWRILEPLRRLTSGRACLVISHNLLTIRDATCIVVLDDGRIVERGTHSELLQREGAYARLYRREQMARGDLPLVPTQPVYA